SEWVPLGEKDLAVLSRGQPHLFTLFAAGTLPLPPACTFIPVAIGLSSLSSGGGTVNVQDLTPSCAGALYGFMNMMGAFMGLVFVSLSGFLIEVTLSWATVFSLVSLVNVSGLAVFIVFGDARRVDLQDYTPLVQI
ncbi:solute carrier family 17 member 9-like, partial [Gymnodraco acuticeps]|uniref:Solute carrier family 17 member 9-like n=1 Tax=Gymnodraco acuticeps TaxID=8218 RepID=A0A6P8UT42_GYMAC